MSPKFRWILILTVALIALGWGGWWLFGRSVEDQVLAAQESFLKAAAKRDWEDLQGLLAADFSSNGGHTRDTAVADAKDVLGQFFSLTIRMEEPRVQTSAGDPQAASVRALIRLDGTGSAIAQLVATRANNLQTPWHFHWRQQGRWPWDWRLARVEHEELEGGRLER